MRRKVGNSSEGREFISLPTPSPENTAATRVMQSPAVSYKELCRRNARPHSVSRCRPEVGCFKGFRGALAKFVGPGTLCKTCKRARSAEGGFDTNPTGFTSYATRPFAPEMPSPDSLTSAPRSANAPPPARPCSGGRGRCCALTDFQTFSPAYRSC